MNSATASSSLLVLAHMQTLLNDADSMAREDDYDRLPQAIKDVYARHEYQWLTEGQKARLIQTETEPETYSE